MPLDISLAALATEMDSIGAPYASKCAATMRDAIPLRGTVLAPETATALALAVQAAHLIREVHAVPLGAQRERLIRALSTTDLLVPPQGNDNERDELWELFLAARFIKKGVPLRFSDDVMPPGQRPEFFVNTCGKELAVEAKRVRGSKLTKRVNKAVAQILSACTGSFAEAGIICLDLSFLEGLHAQHGLWRIESEADLRKRRAALREHTARIAKDILEGIQKTSGRELVVGLVILLSPMLDRSGTLSSVQYFSSVELDAGYRVPFQEIAQRCFANSSSGESS